MKPMSLTVVIPAFNAQRSIGRTISALCDAVEQAAAFSTDIVLVDDGSTDSTAQIAADTAHGRAPLRVVSQPNRGRFEARRAGLEAARGEWVLFLDSRVTLHADGLRFVADRLAHGERVWNGHVYVLTEGNPIGAFWKAVAHIAWRDYLGDPRTTSFGLDGFDRYPKGTGCFLAPRALLLDAVEQFTSYYGDDRRFVNDDTSLIRSIATHERVHISPSFACDYEARSTLRAFCLHAFHRGTVFVDGHLRRESRFFLGAAAFFPVSIATSVVIFRRPVIALTALLAIAGAMVAAASRAGCTGREARGAGMLAPLYAAAHGLGMWRGLGLLGMARIRGGARR